MLDSRQTSTIAADCENPMHIMEVCGSVLTYEPAPHGRELLTWAGPFLGMADRRLSVSVHMDGVWSASVYHPGMRAPLAQAFYKNPEGAVARMFDNAKRDAINSLIFLSDLDIAAEDDPEEGPHALTLAVEAFHERWDARFGESRAAGVFGRYYDETDPRVSR